MPPRKPKTTKEKPKTAQTALPNLESLKAELEPDKNAELMPESEAPLEEEKTAGGQEKYFEAVGRRKESIARVRLYTKKSADTSKENGALITVNGKDYNDYIMDPKLVARIEAPLKKLKSLNRFKATVVVHGGGIAGQADAIRHGLARTLEKFDTNFRKKLKKSGFLTRDAREKERRKYGLKKARKAPQWSKR